MHLSQSIWYRMFGSVYGLLGLIHPGNHTIREILEGEFYLESFGSAPVVVCQLLHASQLSQVCQIRLPQWTTIIVKLYANIVQLKSDLSMENRYQMSKGYFLHFFFFKFSLLYWKLTKPTQKPRYILNREFCVPLHP